MNETTAAYRQMIADGHQPTAQDVRTLCDEVDNLRSDLERCDEARIKDAKLAGELYLENQELRAELARLRSAPVAVEVPEIEPELTEEPVVVEDFADNGAHSQWRLVDGATGKTLWEEACSIPPSRILKDGEIAATSTELAQMLTTANNCSCEGGGVWREDEATDLLRSLRSGETEGRMG